MVTLEDVKKNKEIANLLESSHAVLEAMQYTEHGYRHANYVSWVTCMILQKLGYDEHMQELGKIAGYVHDIGNSINRTNHGIISGILLYEILRDMGMPLEDVCLICAAVGNHEEDIGSIISPLSAALVIADKSDAHRTRVSTLEDDDIHDVVNYSICKNIVLVDGQKHVISTKFYMDESSSVMDYLSIFLPRIIMSEKAAQFLGCTFKLYINDVVINTPKKLNKKLEDIEVKEE